MPAYMPWEPGLNAAPSLEAFPLIARRVAKVPNPSEIANDTTLFERPELPNLIASLDHAPADPQTKVAILRDDRYLFIAFDCVEPNFAGLHRLVPATAPNGELK